jgi:TPR repeat protein
MLSLLGLALITCGQAPDVLLSSDAEIREHLLHTDPPADDPNAIQREAVFENRGPDTVDLFWIQQSARGKWEEQLQFSVKAGEAQTLKCYPSHTFTARSGKEYRLLWVAPTVDGRKGQMRIIFGHGIKAKVGAACLSRAQLKTQQGMLASLKSVMHGNSSFVGNVTQAYSLAAALMQTADAVVAYAMLGEIFLQAGRRLHSLAERTLRTASNAGCADAQFNLALYYLWRGESEAGVVYARCAASSGNEAAAMVLGNVYLYGHHAVPRACQTAVEFYRPLGIAIEQKGADTHRTIEAVRLSHHDQRHEAMDDSATKMHTVEDLAEQGDLTSQLSLGDNYLFGMRGYHVNMTLSYHYFALAAEQNNPAALARLSFIHWRSRPESWPAEAFQVCTGPAGCGDNGGASLRRGRRADDGGKLELARVQGQGRASDAANFDEAVRLMNLAADVLPAVRGVGEAAGDLGFLYLYGQAGRKVNKTKAAGYFHRARDLRFVVSGFL